MNSAVAKRAAIGGGAALVLLYGLSKHGRTIHKRISAADRHPLPVGEAKTEKVAVNSEFFKRLLAIVRIAIPRVASASFFKFSALTLLLFARTSTTIRISDALSRAVRSLVERDQQGFVRALYRLSLLGVPAAIINSLLRFLSDRLATDMSSALTRHAEGLYLHGYTHYRVALNSPVKDIDQRITHDIAQFSESAVRIYQNLAKPLVDVGLYGYSLACIVGREGILTMLGYFAASSLLLRLVTPPFGRMTARLQKLEGFVRVLHSRLVAKAEEVAFAEGAAWEKQSIETATAAAVAQRKTMQNQRLGITLLDNYLVKYAATTVGLGYVLGNIAFGNKAVASSGDLTQEFVRSSRLLQSLSEAIGRIVLSAKEVSVLAGFTQRVAELLKVLRDEDRASQQLAAKADASERKSSSDDALRLQHVDITLPTGRKLLVDLNLEMRRGQHVLIIGPNGSGKTCILRVLRGLWLPSAGRVERCSSIMFLSQSTYLPISTLREAVCYPDTAEAMQAKGRTDKEVQDLLALVDLPRLARSDLDELQTWEDILSGGEGQKLAFARLLYHRPAFACLDESTSALSPDIEPVMYQRAIDAGITLISIAHRRGVWRFHQNVFRLEAKEAKDSKEAAFTGKLISLDQALADQQQPPQPPSSPLHTTMSSVNLAATPAVLRAALAAHLWRSVASGKSSRLIRAQSTPSHSASRPSLLLE